MNSGEAANRDVTRSIRPFRNYSVWLGMTLALLAALAGLARLTRIQGLIREVRIAGHSMAPTLLGPHYDIVCADCRFQFACGEPYVSPGDPLVCPNCGFDEQTLGNEAVQPGDRVLIDRPFPSSSARRWAPVVIQSSAENRQGTVKRVVGLGGEQIGIVDGDVYINGQIARKTIDQLREMAVLVHDTRFRSRDSEALPDRWRPRDDDSGWSHDTNAFVCDATASSSTDWIHYDHWACIAGASPPRERAATSPVYDHYAYNQNISRGPLNELFDLLVMMEFDMQGPGIISVRFQRETSLNISLDSSQNVIRIIENGGAQHWEAPYFGSLQGHHKLEVAVCDRAILIGIDGRPAGQWPFGEQPAEPRPPNLERQLSLGIRGARIEIAGIRVYRDLHWLGPDPGASEWHRAERLREDELFVLGDNVPVSEDSRNWMGVIHRNMLRGRLLRVPERTRIVSFP